MVYPFLKNYNKIITPIPQAKPNPIPPTDNLKNKTIPSPIVYSFPANDW